ncbi:PREDICTED: xylose isomerase-like [Camelina sativa]|uniref:Xylose isomerase n=1 Tax=Camelina sativa TaxID=90675 RepID=A0ABM0YA81_CAMSA|nr:PREDICTED: xylose isomerase-like [Camelina sativa]XP_010498027.1 PREDICTED: xylose isomerase-like [Camelina sativa]XP_010498029.1 PREDICTED: xylose isomerase-like [Camelina sativa]
MAVHLRTLTETWSYAAAQVKKAMEVTHYLGGENYLFWGGREGYQTLLNTDMGKELNHLFGQGDHGRLVISLVGSTNGNN